MSQIDISKEVEKSTRIYKEDNKTTKNIMLFHTTDLSQSICYYLLRYTKHNVIVVDYLYPELIKGHGRTKALLELNPYQNDRIRLIRYSGLDIDVFGSDVRLLPYDNIDAVIIPPSFTEDDEIRLKNETIQYNVNYVSLALNELLRSGKFNSSESKVILLSSWLVYGNQPELFPIKETVNCIPNGAKGNTFLKMEEMLNAHSSDNIQSEFSIKNRTILRLGSYFGQYTFRHNYMNRLLEAALDNDSLVEIYGDQSQSRDMVYLDNINYVISKIISTDAFDNDIFNVGSTRTSGYSVEQQKGLEVNVLKRMQSLKKLLEHFSGVSFEIKSNRQRTREDNNRILLDNGKIVKRFSDIKDEYPLTDINHVRVAANYVFNTFMNPTRTDSEKLDVSLSFKRVGDVGEELQKYYKERYSDENRKNLNLDEGVEIMNS